MKRTLLAALVAGAFATPAFATGAAEDARAQAESMRAWALDFSHDLRAGLTTMYGPLMSSAKVVKGAPYSAEVITETNQALADGNVITHKTAGAIYRDGEGRTRQESAAGAKKEGAIYINDPVESKHIVLMPGSKRAIVTPRPMHLRDHVNEKDKQVVRVGKTEVRVENGRVFVDGKEVADGKVELKAGGKEIRVENGRVTLDGKEVRPGHSEVHVKSLSEGDGTRREEIRVQVVHAGDNTITIPLSPRPPVPPVPGVPVAPISPLPPMPGVQTLRFESTARLGKGVTTTLGMKDFDGVRAEGKSTVWTIPAGQIGNRNPIQVTSESWYAPDLQVTVYSRHNDPRTGESIYRLAGIRRAEPARDLFVVPEGYEQKGRAKREERK